MSMTKTRVAQASSTSAGAGIGVGVARASATDPRRPMKITGFDIAPRNVDWGADVVIEFYGGYTGLGSELIQSGDFTADTGTAAYSSDFTAGVDNWADGGGGGLTLAGNIDVGGQTDCLRITGGAATPFTITRAATTTNLTHYKMTFDMYVENGHDLGFLGLGEDADAWDPGFDHDAGKHPAAPSDTTWTAMTVYGIADGTTLQLSAFTAANGQAEDSLANTKNVYIRNIQLYAVSNDGHWTRSDGTKGYWDMYNGNIDFDASAAATVTYAGTNSALLANRLYQVSAAVGTYVAGDIWISAGGVTGPDMDANGTYTYPIKATATTALVINGDATADGDVDTVSLKQIQGVDTSSDLLYKTCVINATVGGIIHRDFSSPLWCPDGWYCTVSSGGTTTFLDLNVFYEIV